MARDRPREPGSVEPLTLDGIRLMVGEAVREHMELATRSDVQDVERRLNQRFEDLKDLVYKLFIPLLVLMVAAFVGTFLTALLR